MALPGNVRSVASCAAEERPNRLFLGVSLKMYFDHEATLAWTRLIAKAIRRAGQSPAEVVVMPSFPSLTAVADALAGTGARLGAQDLSEHDSGPYTGEVGGASLRQVGCRYVEIGHAERRRLHGETNAVIGLKATAAWRAGLTPLLCLGETQREEPAGERCLQQLDESLTQVPATYDRGPMVIAYEPVWAIGSRDPAPAERVRSVCLELREHTATRYPHRSVRLVYGGAAGPGTLTRLGSAVDGLFLGRFAHQPESFTAIMREAWALAGRHT
ncbi:MAG: triose-phosphate isomerase [Bifidobacteriaceae bacterium]|jgi:triosephosphate isomerase|nr:triose-phosphate isomerase [Bifidobacteriaceae bacterium]